MKNNTILAALAVAMGLILSTISSKAVYSVPTNGLIGHWSGNGTAVDASSVSNNGSFGGNYAPGPMGALAFNLGSAKVIIPYSAAYNFKSYNGWSVGFWFNGNGTPISANNGLFIGQDNGSGYNPKWFIDYSYSVYGNNSDFNFHVNDYNRERIFAGSDSVAAPLGWNQLTVTINNTNNGTVKFYLNGQPLGTTSLGDYVLQTTAPLVFGYAEGLTFSGLMSDVVIYNRVLSTNEILQLATVPPLKITNQPTDISVSTGGNASFVVGVDGVPPFGFQWALNGVNISGATNKSLVLTNVASANVGVYTVTVTNAQGSLTSGGGILSTVDFRFIAAVVINGVVGTNYTIQAIPSFPATNIVTLTNIVLPSQPFIQIDYSSFTNRMQFYQAIPSH